MLKTKLLWLIWSLAVFSVSMALSGPQSEATPALEPEPIAAAALLEDHSVRGTIVVPRSSDGLFYVHGRVNGARVRFLIDTGSNLVILTPTDAARAGMRVGTDDDGLMVRTVGGTVPMTRVRLTRIDIAGQPMADIEAAVASGPGVSLLGQNALGALGTITLGHDHITIRAESQS